MTDQTKAIQEFKTAWENAAGNLSVGLMRRSKEYKALVASLPNESKDKPDAGGWIKHDGGECPVGGNVKVEVFYIGDVETAESKDFEWDYKKASCEIAAYRIVEEKKFVDAKIIESKDKAEGCNCVFNQDTYLKCCGKKWAGDSIVEEKKSEKQTYKLSEMWSGWWVNSQNIVTKCSLLYPTIECARSILSSDEYGSLIAITRADATEFTEGENLK